MSHERPDRLTTAEAWQQRADYHRNRAAQEQLLAARSKTEAGLAAHRLLGDRHLQMMTSAEHVMAMTDPEMPQNSSLHMTGWLMRQCYSDAVPINPDEESALPPHRPFPG